MTSSQLQKTSNLQGVFPGGRAKHQARFGAVYGGTAHPAKEPPKQPDFTSGEVTELLGGGMRGGQGEEVQFFG